MVYKEKDPKTGEEIQNDLTILPYASLSKDVLVLMTEILTTQQIGNVMCDLVNELYCNCEYEPMRGTIQENAIFKMMSDNVGRLSMPYFKKLKNLNNQKDKPKNG